MSGFVANLKYCRKCKRYYDANANLNRLGCPYCRQKALMKFIEKRGSDTNHDNSAKKLCPHHGYISYQRYSHKYPVQTH